MRSVSVVYNLADYFSFLLEMVLYPEPYDLTILLHILGPKQENNPPFRAEEIETYRPICEIIVSTLNSFFRRSILT